MNKNNKFKTKDFDAKTSKHSKPRHNDGFNNKSRNGKSRQNQYRSGISDTETTFKGSNDSSWYNRSPQLIRDVGNIPLNNFLGLPITNGRWEKRLPGIMTLRYAKTPGIAKYSSDPINVAMRDQYAYIRSFNSGGKNYEDVDIGIYLLAAAELYSYAAFLKKVYGCARLFVAQNRYLPKALLTSMGLNAEDIQANLANLRAYINTYLSKIAIVKIPTNFTIIERWNFMDSALYADTKDLATAQIYNFVPQFFRYYDEISDPNGGKITVMPGTVNVPMTSKWKFSDLVQIGDDLATAMLNSEDVGTISGDIQKAYGADKCYILSYIDEAYTTPILYDEEVLMTIQNASEIIVTMNESVATSGAFDISQYNSDLIFDPTITAMFGTSAANMLNLPMDNPTPMDIVVATRLKCAIDYQAESDIASAGTSNTFTTSLKACPTELITDVRIWTLTDTGNVQASNKFYTACTSGYMSAEMLCDLTNFEWHPPYFKISTVPTGGSNNLRTLQGICWDCHKVAKVSAEDIARLHYAAILSLFGTPINM